MKRIMLKGHTTEHPVSVGIDEEGDLSISYTKGNLWIAKESLPELAKLISPTPSKFTNEDQWNTVPQSEMKVIGEAQ